MKFDEEDEGPYRIYAGAIEAPQGDGWEAAVIVSRPALAVAIHGHTDDRPVHGRRYASNWELSVDRATRVARALAGMGIEPSQLSIRGFGQDRPLHANDSDENRMKNRRVEVQFSLSPAGA